MRCYKPHRSKQLCSHTLVYFVYLCKCFCKVKWGFPSGSEVKNPPAMQESQETEVPSLSQEDPLEEGMATHSSILAWKIPWMEEPGRLQSMGLQSRTQLSNFTHSLMDYSPTGSSVYGISQARIPAWVAISSSGGSS